MLRNIRKNKLIGSLGEEIACQYLKELGYDIIDRNFRCYLGEIDLIFKVENQLVFGEVKTRVSVECGFPAESVTKQKRRHIFNTAKYYLYKNKMLNNDIRFDVIEIFLSKNGKTRIHHIKNVFW